MSTKSVVSPVVPHHMICPLTMEIMTHPVLTSTGFCFEKDALIQWMQKSDGTCPLSRKPLCPSDIISNGALEQQILGWKRVNGYVAEDDDDNTDSSTTQEDSLSWSENNLSGSRLYSSDDGSLVRVVESRIAERQAKKERKRRRRERRERRSRRAALEAAQNRRPKNILVRWVRSLTNKAQ